MALQKQPLAINFSMGLETKVDPYQVSPGKFLELSNSVFTTAGRLTKRNGYENLTPLPNQIQTTATTFNGNLIATGTDLYAYSAATDQWLNQGNIQPVQLDTLSMVRASTAQYSPDTAVTTSGLICTVYMDSGVGYYQISDSVTGQQIKSRTAIPNAAINPRVVIMGVYFIISYIGNVSGTPTLQYLAIPTANPAYTAVAGNVSASVDGFDAGFDVLSIGNKIFYAWGTPTNAISVAFLTPSLTVSTPVVVTGSGHVSLVSITLDQAAAMFWVSYWESSTSHGYTLAFSVNMIPLVAKTQFAASITIATLTSAASNRINSIFYQNIHDYGFDSTIRSDFISTIQVTPGAGVGVGVVGSPSDVIRSVGLASKAFADSDSGKVYMLVAYGDLQQASSVNNSAIPTYFLIDSTGAIYLRIAASNGGGYAQTQVLSSPTLLNGVYYIPYLITDFLTTTNKGTGLPAGTPTNPIYTQTGVNLAKISFSLGQQHSSEIAGALHLTGGQLWEYDGVRPVEHGFQVWPENVKAVSSPTAGNLAIQQYFYVFTYEWTDNAGNLHRSAPSIPFSAPILAAPAGITGNTTNSSTTISVVSPNANGIQVGMGISGAGIQAGSKVASIVNNGTITISLPATATAIGVAFTFTVASSNTVYVPTDRLTYKVAPNPIRIVGYRWSTNQQVYYQFTSVTSPTVNDTTVDYVTFTDSAADASILGNTILYTTGGVVENIAAPACIASTLFSNRLFLIDAEDRNVLWFSKQVIENVPVEMSDLLTLYIAPTTGAQGSTGPMTALAAMDDKLIIFKKDAIYYINGNGPDNTGSNSTFSDPVFVTATVGCVNPNSIVLMPDGIMFQSDKGIWLLGRGLGTTYIGAPVEGFNSQTVLSATTIPGTNQVRFVLDNNTTLMYDYFYNQWATHTNISAISATLYGGMHTYLNSYGQIFQETTNTYLDGSIPVLMSLTTSWINLAGVQGLERFYFGNLLGTYLSPFKLEVRFAYNYNSSATQSIIVTPDNYGGTWGSQALWGSGPQWGGSEGNVFTARLFPNQQKCQSFQVTINEIYDSSFGVSPGAGLTLSGLALIVGTKKGYRTQSAAKSFG